ncbi:MAG: MmgE/PrpD family protein [Burkholderiales bacterium]
MSSETRLTARLAEFATGLRYRDLPAPAAHEVKRALLDFMGVALLGAHHRIVDLLLAHLAQLRGRKATTGKTGGTVIGRAERLDPVSAAWVNGSMGHVYDFDDVHSAAGIHPGIVIVPPSLAAGEWSRTPGRQLIAAMAAGYEVAGRVGEATQLTHYEPGWHSTGTVGTLGAAAAAANLLKLDPAQGNYALGIAASEAAGLRVSFGSMMKSLHAGNASANGVRAAFLASSGFTGPETGLEGARGFLEVACAGADAGPILAGLGRDYCFIRKGYKLYSCGGVVHPALDAALALRPQLETKVDRIRKIHAVVHPQVLEQMRVREPVTGMQSKFSPYHAIAVTLLDGAALPGQFADARAALPDVTALRQKVEVESNPGVRKDETRMTVTLDNGEAFEHHVEHARGYSPDNPPSDAELQDKFMALAVPVLGDARSRELSARIWALEAEKNTKRFLQLCRPVA